MLRKNRVEFQVVKTNIIESIFETVSACPTAIKM